MSPDPRLMIEKWVQKGLVVREDVAKTYKKC